MPKGLKLFLTVLLFATSLFSADRSDYSYKFENVSFLDELPQLSVRSILQNRQGFMWLATQGGLVKYDGYSIRHFSFVSRDPNSIGGNDIKIIFEDSRGLIWIGLLGRGLDCFDPVSESFTHFRAEGGQEAGLGGDYVQAICEDTHGDLWIGVHSGGLNRVQVRKGKRREPAVSFTRYLHDPDDAASLSNNTVWAVCPDRFGKIWVGTDYGLNRLDPKTDKFTRFYHDPRDPGSLSSNRISALTEDHSGVLWIGTFEGGLNRSDLKNDHLPEAFTQFRSSSGLGSDVIRCMFEDSSGKLWVGTVGGGLNTFNRDSQSFNTFLHNPADRDSLGDNRVLSIAEDRTGNIWLGLNRAGVNKLAFNSRRFVNLKVGVAGDQNPDTSVFSIYEDRSGNLWAGDDSGYLHKFQLRESEKSKQRIRLPKSCESLKLSNRFLRAILEDKQGYLWVASRGQGLFKILPMAFNTGTHTVYSHDPENPASIGSNSLYSIYEDAEGSIWVGTAGAGISLLTLENRDRGLFIHKRRVPGDPHSLSQNFVRVIYGDSRGMIWVGTDSGGLNCYDPESERFVRFTYRPVEQESISSNSVLSILETDDGVIWAGTADAGLNRFDRDNGTFTCYSIEDGLPDNTVYGLLEDEHHNLWISTKKGLARFTPRTGEFVCFNVKDGIQDNEFNTLACFRNPDNGQMYFGGILGISTFFPQNIQKNRTAPQVQITSFEVLNRETKIIRVADQSDIELSYKDSMFSFEFVALDFSDPRRNRYAYRLEGFNRDWIRTGWSNRRATFTNIPPGRYTFRVRGSNQHGVWNEEGSSIQIFIKPPFWQTWWFRIILILLFSMTIMALHKKRMKNLRIRLKTEQEINKIYAKARITDREAEIIELLKKRKSYKQIEDELFISYHTVKNHIQNIYKKLGINDRTELGYYLKSIEDEVKKRKGPPFSKPDTRQ